MKRSLRNKLRMFLAVQAACKKHQGVWEDISNFADLFAEFETKLEQIGEEMMVQSSILEGKSENKSNVKQLLAKHAMIIIGILRGYAKKEGDNEIKAKIDLSESAITNGRDAEILKFCEMVHQMAEELTPQLTEMGKDLSSLQILKEKIEAFNEEIVSPMAAISRRKLATERLEILFREATGLLKDEMDAVMNTFEDDESGFYKEYFNVRNIIDLKSKRSVEDAEVDESESEADDSDSEDDDDDSPTLDGDDGEPPQGEAA